MDFFEQLKAGAISDWQAYVKHEFLAQLAAGTLPKQAFQTYLLQDYLFLIQFARAKALAVYKSRTLADMRQAEAGLVGIMTEMDLHVRVCARWGLTPDDLEKTPEHGTTIAYTRYVIDCGLSGDLLDLLVALAPCVIGYAEIGSRLAREMASLPEHPYADWIHEYASDAFQSVASDARSHLNKLATKYVTEQRFQELIAIFAKASRLEADFWQMGLDAADEQSCSTGMSMLNDKCTETR